MLNKVSYTGYIPVWVLPRWFLGGKKRKRRWEYAVDSRKKVVGTLPPELYGSGGYVWGGVNTLLYVTKTKAQQHEASELRKIRITYELLD